MSSSEAAKWAAAHPDIVNEMYWKTMGTTPAETTNNIGFRFYMALGLVLSGLILNPVLLNTFKYYQYFRRSDPVWALVAVGVGFVLVVGTFITSCVQLQRLTAHAFTDYINIIDSDRRISLVMSIVSVLLTWEANAYYSWRCYRLSNSRRWVLFAFFIPASGIFIFAVYTFGRALLMPKITVDSVEAVQNYFTSFRKSLVAQGWLPLIYDLAVCTTTIALLSRTKTSLVHLEKSLYKRIISFIFESMLPPTTFMFIIMVSEAADRLGFSEGVGWRVTLSASLPGLYFHSLLHTLVSRRTLRDLLNRNLSDQGIDRMSNNNGSSSHAGSYTSFPGRSSKPDRSLSPSIHVKVDSISTVYHHDLEGTLPSTFGKRSINRDVQYPVVVVEADEEPVPHRD